MNRLTLAFLLTGTAMAGGGTEPSLSQLRPLLGLRGAAFDLTWVDQTGTRQDLLGGLDELEGRYGRDSLLKNWAAADQWARRASNERLRLLRNRIQTPDSVSSTDVVVSVPNGAEQDFLTHFDAFFLTETPSSPPTSAPLPSSA